MFDYREISHDPKVVVVKLPDEIVAEISTWVEECRAIKNHPLAKLREHDNIGTGHNSYQVSVPSQLVEDSYTLAFINRFCAECFGGEHRDWKLRKWDGHFDSYDMWANFAYEGDDNPLHRHSGSLSGVIYVQNDGLATLFPDLGTGYDGELGTLILFPSSVVHGVNTKKTSTERVTLAFNVVQTS